VAGDWIKLETATLNKPEVLEAAELLNITRREAVGLFADYFAWLDQHLVDDDVVPVNQGQNRDKCPGVVPMVSRRSVENILACPGFAAVLEAINWAKFDDRARTLTVINYERHNGKTAKTRALEQRKKALQRDKLSRTCPVVIGTDAGPELRSVEVTSKSSSTASPVDNLSKGITFAQAWEARGKALGINARNGEKQKDYIARVREFVKQAGKPS
jgi:hypothetical protein